jgi:hypothetical protein
MKNKSNIIIVLLTLIVMLLIGMWVIVFTPINISRRCTFISETTTADSIELNVSWTARYKAPIIFPADMKQDTEKKIEIYGLIRINAFTGIHKSDMLFKMSKKEMQDAFDIEDIVKEIAKYIPDLSKNLNMIKSVRLNKIWLNKDSGKDKRIEFKPDGVRNTVLTMLNK